jgi:FlaA1/EpsC-like NDP-sugar epimerase
MGLTDSFSVFAALLLAYQLRFDQLVPTLDFWLLLLTVPLITPVVYLTMRLYRVHQYSTAEEFRRIIVVVSLIVSATVTVSFWSKASFSRLWMLLSWGLGLVLALSVRRLWHWRVRRTRLEGKLTFRTLIVGTSREAGRLAHVLDNPTSGFVPLGYVRGSDPVIWANTLPLLGDLKELQSLIRHHAANCLFVASSALTFEDISWVAQAARKEGVEVRVSANLPRMLSNADEHEAAVRAGLEARADGSCC